MVIRDFKKGYQPGTNVEKLDKCSLITHGKSISSRWRKFFSELVNVHGVNDVRQSEIHTAEPLVSERKILILR